MHGQCDVWSITLASADFTNFVDHSSIPEVPAHTLLSSHLRSLGAQEGTAEQLPLLPTTVPWSLATTVRKWPIVALRSEEHVVGNFSVLNAPPRPQSPRFQTQAGACSLSRIFAYVRTTTVGGLSNTKRFLAPGFVGRSVYPIRAELCSFTCLFEDTARSSCLQQLGGSKLLIYMGNIDACCRYKVDSTRIAICCPRSGQISILIRVTPQSSALTPFLGNGTRTTTKTGVIPAVHGLAPQLTINVCVLSEPFDHLKVFHKFTGSRSSDSVWTSHHILSGKIAIPTTVRVRVLQWRGVAIFARGTRKRDVVFTGFQGPRQ